MGAARPLQTFLWGLLAPCKPFWGLLAPIPRRRLLKKAGENFEISPSPNGLGLRFFLTKG